MALQWIRGDFKTGNFSESAILPVIKNNDTINPDINAGDSGTLTLSRADLPSDWRTYLKPFETMVALVDPDVTFATGVMAAYRVNKISGNVKDVVKIQVTSINQHLSKRIITSVYNTTDANPNSGVTFTASTWQGVMKAVVSHAFSTTGIPVGAPMPPAILGTVDGTVSGNTYSYTALNADAVSYKDAMDEIRDTLSPGNEYRFVPRWSSSAKTKIVFDVVIGTDAAPHIGEATTRTIQIADNAWKPISFGQSASADNIATRLIGHSTYGTGTTGSDFTTKTSTAGSTILEDQFFNPGVPLTSAQMSAQLTSRLGFAAGLENEATFERSYDTIDELRTMLSYLGNMVTFTGTEQAAQFGTTMRIVGLSFSPERRSISVSLLPKAAKYPQLPKDRNKDLGGGKTGSGGGVGTSTPVSPPAYSPPVVPPFTLPKDNYTDAESILEPIDMRHFAGWNEFGDKRYSKANLSMYWHKQPDVTRSRINYATGELIGLSTVSRMLWGFSDTAPDPYAEGYFNDYGQTKAQGGVNHNKDLDIYSVDITGMFNNDSNPYMNQTATTVANADNFKKRIGTIPYSLYSDLEMSPETFKANIPAAATSSKDSKITSIADYNMFCTEDLQTVYVQIMVTTAKSQINLADSAGGWKSYSSTQSRLYKGIRGADGTIPSWEGLGNALSIDKGTDNQKTFFSTAIYEIQGQFHAFGGFLIPISESDIKAPALLPSYELKFYQHGHTMVNVSNFVLNLEEINLPGLTMLETGSVNENLELKAKFPYAINVDYGQQKISIGISRGANKKTSQFFSSSFSNLLSFTKIMSTERENKILGNVSDTSSSYITTFEDPFRFRSKAPIFYKNNYFLFNASSVASYPEIMANKYLNKQINHIRARAGFEDTVTGSLKLRDYTTYNAAKDAYVVWDSTASSANNLGAFGNYWFRESYYFRETRNVYGMEYFIINGFLYMICDTTHSEYENSKDTDYLEGRGGTTKFRYWIGKFRIKDEIL